jgi:hypothetical protein
MYILTLQTIATILNHRTGDIYGQSIRYKTINQQQENSIDDFENDEIEMVYAFTGNNHQSSEFYWNLNYNRGFDTLNFKDFI